MHNRLHQLTRTHEYIRNAAYGMVTEWQYELVDDGDWLDDARRQGIGRYRYHLNYNTETGEGDGSVQYVEEPAIPNRYSKKSWEGSVGRMRSGRNGEVLVQTALHLAGVKAHLLPMVIDGDTSNPNIDIIIESPTLNQYGKFSLFGYDVKTHRSLWFTNNPATFPKTLRVDSVGAHERKLEACLQREYPYKGTIHLSLRGGGMLVIPNAYSDDWLTRDNEFYGNGNKEPYQYNAPRSCMRPLAKLVKHYTNNTPAQRSLNDGILQFSKPINHRRCPLLSKMMSYPKDRLQHETGEQRWQNAVNIMAQHKQLPCYTDALELDASNAPLETKLAFLDSLF